MKKRMARTPITIRSELFRRPHITLGQAAVLALAFWNFLAPRPAGAIEETTGIGFRPPSLHFYFGARYRKAPDSDTLDSLPIGFKFVPFSVRFGSGRFYLSALGVGAGYVGHGYIAGVLSPIILNHASGVGLSLDLYTYQANNPTYYGGGTGFSANVDPIRFLRWLKPHP